MIPIGLTLLEKTMRFAVCILICLLTLGLQQQVEAQDEPIIDPVLTQQFRELEVSWTEAIASQDRSRIEAFLAPEFRLSIANFEKPIFHGAREGWLERATSGYKISSFEFRDLAAQRYGDVVVVMASYYQNAQLGESSRSGEFSITDVWVRVDGSWQVTWRLSSAPHVGR